MTRGRVVVQRRRRPLAAERPVVAHVDPEPARAGLHLREHLHGRVVDMQALGGEHVAAKLGEDGFEGGGASADPVGERRDFDLDAFASKGGALRFSGRWSPNLPTRIMASRLGPAKPRGIGCDGAGGSEIDLAVPTGELLAHPLNDLPAPRLAFERLGHHLAELAQPSAAALAADARGGLDDALDRQVLRQLAGPALRRRRGALAGSGAAISALVSSSACVSSRSSIASSSCSTRSLPRSDDWPKCSRRALANCSFSRSISRARTFASFCASLSAASLSASISRWARIIACALARSFGRSSGRPSKDVRAGSSRRRREQIRQQKSPVKRPLSQSAAVIRPPWDARFSAAFASRCRTRDRRAAQPKSSPRRPRQRATKTARARAASRTDTPRRRHARSA